MHNYVVGGVGLVSFIMTLPAVGDGLIVAVINMAIVVVAWWGASKVWQGIRRMWRSWLWKL